jgi:predicted dinucleotide-binding enzyme
VGASGARRGLRLAVARPAANIESLIADVGLRPIRVGDIDAIEVVDGVGRLWLTLVFRQGYPRRLGFQLLGG